MLIRHAEKPPETGPPPAGVHEDGVQHEHSLIVRGWQRAGALAPFFAMPWDPAIATPTELYSPPRRHDDGDHGRPYQTLIPLAARLGLAANTSYALDAESELAADVRTRDGVILIAWEHNRIPLIANALLGDATTEPQTWPDDRFDLVWILDLQPDGRYAFSQRAQLLLHGDRADVAAH
jgi:hypothetical protein